jgi:beta-glucosidase
MKFIAAFVFLCSFFTVGSAQVYLDPDAPIGERVEDLLERMTLEEKIGQMTQTERTQFNGGDIFNIATRNVGSILSGGGSSPGGSVTDWVEMYNSFQEQALSTELGIPLIYGVDAVHGHNNVHGAVIFPHNIGMGCTRNPELVEECSRITALEVAATGIDWTFSPCVAVPQNERWGRTYEGFGENTELVNEMAHASVSGYQSDSLGNANRILACAKHYLGDGGTFMGIDQGNTILTEDELRAIHLPPFESAIEAGVGSVMASYNKWNGAHCHGNQYLLTDVLKDELGFEGFVISDWAGINQVNGDFGTAIANSINAGVDMAMQPYDYMDYQNILKSLVEQEIVSMDRIDDAVRRILKVKFQLGLFENPFVDQSLLDTVGCNTHREVARQAVRESLVLLKNDGILPLSVDQPNILLAGWKADDIGVQCGGWSISWQGSAGETTVGTTIKEAFEEVLGQGSFSFVTSNNIPQSDLAVVVVGETPYAEGAGDIGLGSDKFYIPQEDQQLIQAIKSEGIPMVVILLSGRPLILGELLEDANAIIAAWLPGTEGGGITDVLFGEYDPSGKLSHSWPANENMVPVNVGDDDYDPLFEYGYGLDYGITSHMHDSEAVPSYELDLYPNPFQNSFLITNLPVEPLSFSLYDVFGRKAGVPIIEEGSSFEIDGSVLPSGTYFLEVKSNKGVFLGKIVKQ